MAQGHDDRGGTAPLSPAEALARQPWVVAEEPAVGRVDVNVADRRLVLLDGAVLLHRTQVRVPHLLARHRLFSRASFFAVALLMLELLL